MYQESCYEYLFSDFVRHICPGVHDRRAVKRGWCVGLAHAI